MLHFILLGTLLMIPGAAAFQVTIDGPEANLQPGLGPGPFTLNATATCQEVYDRQIPVAGVNEESFLHITIESSTGDAAGTIEISGPTTILLPTSECLSDPQGSVSTGPVEYGLSASRNAPGLTNIGFTMTAEMEGGDMGEPVSADANGITFVDYYAAAQFEVTEPISTVGVGKDHAIEIQITNFGNSATRVSFSLQDPPQDGLIVTLPEDTIVGSAAKGDDNTATAKGLVNFDPGTRGWINQVVTFTIIAETAADDDPTQEGNTGTMSIALRAREVKGAPAPTALFVAPALVAAALITRNTRGET